MRHFGRLIAIGVAVAAIAGMAAGRPALASTRSVVLADGTSLRVWEQSGRIKNGQPAESRLINYSVTDASGMHLGVVPATADAALDSSPFLSMDATGSAVLVWSRFDGTFRKIAYARFSGGAWTDFHYLTFGPGNDDLPRIGTGATGSFLFYLRPPDKYEFAPLDLIAGRLFAAPRPVGLGSARRDIEAPRRPGSTQGATVDVPVVNRCPGSRVCGGADHSMAGLPGSGGLTTLGGTVDIPVVNGHTKSIFWDVGSSGDCSRMVLVIPSYDLTRVFVFRFTNGATSLLKEVLLPSPAEEDFAQGLAASHLPFVCN